METQVLGEVSSFFGRKPVPLDILRVAIKNKAGNWNMSRSEEIGAQLLAQGSPGYKDRTALRIWDSTIPTFGIKLFYL